MLNGAESRGAVSPATTSCLVENEAGEGNLRDGFCVQCVFCALVSKHDKAVPVAVWMAKHG